MQTMSKTVIYYMKNASLIILNIESMNALMLNYIITYLA